MKTAELKVLPVSVLKPAAYNPRKKLKPGDKEYEKIKKSIHEFGFADPLVVNADMTIIGGHQRLTVAMELGYTEVPCAVVDVDKAREKALNVALNKITGAWDEQMLAELLKDMERFADTEHKRTVGDFFSSGGILMYGVSDTYKTAMHQAVQKFRLTGTLGTTDFTDENILAGSFSITNQCCGNNEVQIGQVYVGELDATFLNLPLTRYSLKGMKITPSFGLMLADGSYEDLPLGVFNISEASWTMSGLVVKAYDNMSLLDKKCNTRQTTGTAYEMALLATEACGLTLGTTEAEFRTFANGTETFSLYAESDIETWRDFISWVAQTVGCNAMAGRDGSIIFRSYGQTVVDTLDEEHRFEGASFSDFETKYTGLSCVNLADQTTKYYHVENDDALVYNLGTNPLMQYGVDETKDALRTNVLTALQKIDYVPFKVALIGNPAYDLMDVFSFSGGIADAKKLFCMTKYNFKYNGGYEMEGVGENPALASAKSKTDKNISGLLAQVEQGKLGITTFTNASAYAIATDDLKVISIQFATSEANHMQFFGQIIVDVKADAVNRSSNAAGTIVVPFPATTSGSSGSEESSGTDTGSDNSEGSSSETTEEAGTTTDVSVEKQRISPAK